MFTASFVFLLVCYSIDLVGRPLLAGKKLKPYSGGDGVLAVLVCGAVIGALWELQHVHSTTAKAVLATLVGASTLAALLSVIAQIGHSRPPRTGRMSAFLFLLSVLELAAIVYIAST